MADLTMIYNAMTTIAIVVVCLAVYYYINKHMFQRIVNEAIVKLDEKCRTLNALRNMQ